MKLEGVIVCDRYGDFLAASLPHHRSLFDRLVVVTSYEDSATQRICEYNHVQCVKTDSLESRKGLFRKGSGINAGLEKLDRDGWLVHMDADIVCPPLTRQILENLDKDPGSIYGCDRYMVRSHEDWQRHMEMPRLLHENNSWIHMVNLPIGTRVSIKEHGGWVPIGFFQMWHSSVIKVYPEGHTTAAREDMRFALNWPRSKRVFLPELVVYHLDSAPSQMGQNWGGRKTDPFTGDGCQRKIHPPGVCWSESAEEEYGK